MPRRKRRRRGRRGRRRRRRRRRRGSQTIAGRYHYPLHYTINRRSQEVGKINSDISASYTSSGSRLDAGAMVVGPNGVVLIPHNSIRLYPSSPSREASNDTTTTTKTITPPVALSEALLHMPYHDGFINILLRHYYHHR